jgi:hypothetical protein
VARGPVGDADPGRCQGGSNLPDADRKNVYRHLAAHYEEFGKEPPTFDEIES